MAPLPDSEIQRLSAVYRGYSERGLGSTKWSPDNPGNQAIVRERDKRLHALLETCGFLPLGARRILDLGCGMGGVLAGLQKWGARPENLVGVDLLPERVCAARERFPQISFRQANAEALPFPDCSFDLVLLFTVISSILSREMTLNAVSEVCRVLRSGGAIIWYDFRFKSPFNSNVRGVGRGAIRQLFPQFCLHLQSITLLPPLARRLCRFAPGFYGALAGVPFLRTHYVGLLIKP